MNVTMYLLFILTPINFISNYYYLVYRDLSYIGAAYHVITVQTVLLTTYTLFVFFFTNASKYWPGFTIQVFHQWGEFLKLGNVVVLHELF
jgi:MATE family multidrug resistance protein